MGVAKGFKELQDHRSKEEAGNFPSGRLDAIINEVKKRRKLDVDITKKFVRQRISRGTISVYTPSGPDSPLAPLEPKILNLILSMAEIREPLRPSRCIQVINDLIKDTPTQQKLIEFKTQMKCPTTHTPTNCIGHGYWQCKISEICMI